jgi:hypothetical protein
VSSCGAVTSTSDLPSLLRPAAVAFSGFAHKLLTTVVFTKNKPKTYQLYEYACRVWLVPFFGDREVRTIGAADVEALQAHVSSTPRVEGGGAEQLPPGPKTNNEIVGCLSSMLATAKRWKILPENPCDGVERLEVPPAAFDFYDARETATWLAACQEVEPSWFPFFYAGFRTGLRQGELFALRVEDLDSTLRRMTVRRSYGAAAEPNPATGFSRRVYKEGTTKNGRERIVGIVPSLGETLRAHVGKRASGLVWTAPREGDDEDEHLTRAIVIHRGSASPPPPRCATSGCTGCGTASRPSSSWPARRSRPSSSSWATRRSG